MKFEEAKEQAKQYLETYLQEHNINTKSNFKCLSGKHEDKNPSMSYFKKNNTIHCFSCNTTLDIFNVAEILDNVPSNETFRYIFKKYNIPVDNGSISDRDNAIRKPIKELTTDYTSFYKECNTRLSETNYYRGISITTLNRFNIGYAPAWINPKCPHAPASPRLIIPTSETSYIARDTRDNLTEKQDKYKKLKVGSVNLFNAEALASDSPVFITEGEIDALSIIDLGYNAVGLGSANNIDKLVAALPRYNSHRLLIISLDSDRTGITAAIKLQKELDKLGYNNIIYDVTQNSPLKDIESIKLDINELLMRDRVCLETTLNMCCTENFSEQALIETDERFNKIHEAEIQEAEQYIKSYSAGYYMSDYFDRIKTDYSEAIPTSFNELDKILNGGLRTGLIAIGGVPSIGKSTFVLQMINKIAACSDKDVLYFALEMSKQELIAKCLSRISYEINPKLAFTALEAMNPNIIESWNNEKRDLFDLVTTSEFSQQAKNIYIRDGYFTIDDIKQQIENHILYTANTPIVVLDYLQIINLGEHYADATQIIAKAVLDLKQLSLAKNIPVICISSFNRDAYDKNGEIKSFKQSGNIEYTADVAIALDYSNILNENSEDFKTRIDNARSNGLPIKINVSVLKNRNGRIGTTTLEFNPKYNLFS